MCDCMKLISKIIRGCRLLLLPVLLLTAVQPVCCYEVLILPETPVGGQALFVRLSKPGVFRYRIWCEGMEIPLYKQADKLLETVIPLGIEDSGEKEILIKKDIAGIRLSKRLFHAAVEPRNIKTHRLSAASVRMRDRQPPAADHRALFLNAINTVSEQRLWDGEFIAPLKGPVSSGFALRRQSKSYSYYHRGVDFAVAQGTPVKAINSGVAALSRANLNIYGNVVVIDHGQGVTSCYMHLHKNIVAEGAYVRKGEVIGEVGNTGWSTNPHLHLGIFINGSAIDPLWWIGFSKEMLLPADDADKAP